MADDERALEFADLARIPPAPGRPYTCPGCGCQVDNPDVHRAWHVALGKPLTTPALHKV